MFGQADAEPAENEIPPPDPLAGTREGEEAVVFDPPEVAARDVAATPADSRRFGSQLAASAWSLGCLRLKIMAGTN